MRWICWYYPFYRGTSAGGAVVKKLLIFEISNLHIYINPTSDKPPLQSGNLWKWRTRCTQSPEFAGTLPFIIALLMVLLQPKISLVSEFQTPPIHINPPSPYHNHGQKAPIDGVLDLFDALNFVVQSISPGACWWWLCWAQCTKIPDFRILLAQHTLPLICHHWSQTTPVDHVLGLFNALNLVVPSVSA